MRTELPRGGIIARMIGRPLPLVLALAIIAAAGLLAAHRIGVDILPNLNYPLFNVITHYPGASPADVEILITRPLEGSLASLKNIRRVSSISAQGFSRVTVEFIWGTEVLQAQQQVVSALAKSRGALPPGTEPVIENIGSTLQEIAGYAVTSRDHRLSQTELRNIVQYKIAPLIMSAGGVSRTEVFGGAREAYIVDADTFKMGTSGVALPEIRDAIARANVQKHAGFIDRHHMDYPLRGMARFKGVDDIGNVLVRSSPPRPPLLLGQLARIFKGTMPERYLVHTDGVPGVVFTVYKQPSASTLDVADAVRDRLAQIEESLPEGLEITPYYNQAELIRHEAGDLMRSIVVGIILVIAVLMILLGDWRGGAIISLTIPLIVLVSLLFVDLAGFSLNVITLGAYAVAIGMIVDGSIIVLENIHRHRRKGLGAIDAAIAGTREIAGPDISGVLTTIAVFVPLLLLGGIPGRIFFPFGAVVSIILITSLIFSLTFIPAVMGMRKDSAAGSQAGETFFKRLGAFNGRLLKKALAHRRATILITIGTLCAALALLVLSPVGFLPDIDEGAILCEYIMPPGTSLAESSRVAHKFETALADVPEVALTYLRVGSAENTYQVERVNRGEIIAKLIDRDKRHRAVGRIIADMKKRVSSIEGAISFFHQPTQEKIDESFSGLPVIFGITLYGDDYEKLAILARKIEAIAKKCPMVDNVVNNAVIRVPQTRIDLDRMRLAALGLTPDAVLDTLALAMKGGVATEVVEQEHTIPVFLTSGTFPPVGKTIDELRNLPIRIPGGGYVSLFDIADIHTDYTINQLDHRYLKREITLSLEIAGTVGQVVRWFKPRLAKLDLPSGYSIEFTGQYKSLMEALEGLVMAALLAVALVYLIMLIQFGSPLQPLIILVELPLSFIGGCLALAITRQPINLSSMIGFLTLIGVAVNNGIVLIDYANRMRRRGMASEDAVATAAAIRLRPIVLTTLTTIFGLLPVALSSSAHKPLAVVVIGGLLISAFLTLNVLPVLYCTVGREG